MQYFNFLTSLVLSLALFVFSVPAHSATADEIVQKQFDLILNGPEKVDGLTGPQRRDLFNQAVNHPVAGPEFVEKYDPSGMIGFCFGRALCVDLIARQMGLAKKSLMRLFIVGDMRSDPAKPEWRFHVTTMVKGTNGLWYAVDPIMKGPMPAGDWIGFVKKIWDYKGQTKLYLTSQLAIMPDTRIFRDLQSEKGDRIIELNFEPGQRPDEFQKISLDGHEVFSTSEEAMQKYFLHIDPLSPNRFNWESITINNDFISFNGYFADLAKDLKEVPRQLLLKNKPTMAAAYQMLLESSLLQPARLPLPRQMLCGLVMENPAGGLGSFDFYRSKRGEP